MTRLDLTSHRSFGQEKKRIQQQDQSNLQIQRKLITCQPSAESPGRGGDRRRLRRGKLRLDGEDGSDFMERNVIIESTLFSQ